MKRSFFGRRAFLIIAVAALLFFPIAMGAKRALLSNQNNMTDWLPAGFEETAELDKFQEHFAGERFIIVTWDGCTLGNPEKLELLANKLVPPEGTTRTVGYQEEGHPAYRETGQWKSAKAPQQESEKGIQRTHDAGSGGNTAAWKFDGLLPVPYQLQTTWTPNAKNASNATYKIFDGEKEVETVVVDQTAKPANEADETRWFTLATEKPKNGSLTVKLTDEADGTVVAAPVRLMPKDWPFKNVITGPRLLKEMTEGDLKLSREEAISRLRGLVIGPDHKTNGDMVDLDHRQTCLIVTLNESKEYKSRDLVGRGMAGSELGPLMRFAHRKGIKLGRDPGVLFQLTNQLQIDQDAVHLGGPPVDAVAIDEEGETTLVRLVGLAGLIGLGLAYWCFRSFRVTFMVFTSGVLSAMLCLAFVWWFGLFEQYALGRDAAHFGTLDAVLMSMPAVVYVLGLSGAIHLINYYRDAVAHGGLEGATDRAVRMGWGPCALAAFTTAIGLASLYVSNIVPIQKFGIYSAFGVLGTLLALFLLLPSLLELGVSKRGIILSDKAEHTMLDRPGFVRRVSGFGDWILRHNVAVSVCGILLIALGCVGLTRIGTSIQLLKLFSPGARLLDDYEYLEHNIGHLIPMELLIKVDQKSTRDTYDPAIGSDGRYHYSLLERMELVQRVQQRIESLRMEKHDAEGTRVIQPVGKAVSVATFADRLDDDWSDSPLYERENRNVLNKKLVEAYEAGKLPRDYWSIDNETNEELWRVHLRVAAFEDIDYGTFSTEIHDVVEPVLYTYRWRDRIIEQLAAKGTKLTDAKIYMLGVSESNDPEQIKRSLPLMLLSLLRRGGAKVEFHDRHFLKLPKGTPYGLSGEKRKKEEPSAEFLARQDLVLVTGDYPEETVKALTKYAPVEVVDLTESPEGLSELAQSSLDTSYTGAVPVVYKAQRELLNGLIRSIALAFVTIAFVMMFKLGGVMPVLVSMIPNVFPVMIVFGAMGWMGLLVDIGAMMTASIALGVAVDDTVHFLTWFRRGLDEGKSRREAVKLAYSSCARAMTQTTIIGGLGLAVFALSTFTPTKVFGVMMLSILTTALAGDLILLPALLTGPLGRFFKPSKKAQVAAQASSDEPRTVEKIPAQLAPTTNSDADVSTPNRRHDSAHRHVDH